MVRYDPHDYENGDILYAEELNEMDDAIGSNSEAIDRLEEKIPEKLDVPTGTPVVGKTIKIKSVNPDGTFVCEWADGALAA